MEKIMTIKEFIEKYDAAESDIEREALLDGIIARKYVPLSDKAALSKEIVKRANLKDGKLDQNSVALYVSYIMLGIVDMYTTLKIDVKKPMQQYDLLQERLIVEFIIERVKDDAKEFQTVLNMCRDDFNAMYYSTPGIVNRTIDSLKDIANEVIKQVDSDTLEGLIALIKSSVE